MRGEGGAGGDVLGLSTAVMSNELYRHVHGRSDITEHRP